MTALRKENTEERSGSMTTTAMNLARCDTRRQKRKRRTHVRRGAGRGFCAGSVAMATLAWGTLSKRTAGP